MRKHKNSWYGGEDTPLVDVLEAMAFMRTKGTVISSTPAKLPGELRANTPARMESHERGFTHAGNLYVDRSERVWLSADAFVVREFDTYYCIAVRRADNGTTIEVPDNIRFVPANECPFEAVLPVLHIEIVPDAE